ncbi:MBL fold metallo-hydrolase [Patulibacter minatonensis]|uniref:MBL fold metallo-hydrolase n=1 Tax=Patulibacter minatonensis TaxID=298163 RepID=UPI00047B779A|nr:MBL fold metallo-hydrolase [Patulibacter minatonensis]
MRILGKSPAWQDVDGACSGYLVEEDGYTLLLDCGNGVFGKLRAHMDYVDLDACVISHCHADHTLDLVPYSYALSFAPRQQPVPVPRGRAPTTRRDRSSTSRPGARRSCARS